MSSDYNEEHFGINFLDTKTGQRYQISFGENYITKLYNLAFEIYYICNQTVFDSQGICELNDEEKEHNKLFNAYEITFNYTGQKVDHQNSESPLKKEYIQNDFMFSINDKMSFSQLKWKTIKYTEERGLLGMFDDWFGISNEYYGGV